MGAMTVLFFNVLFPTANSDDNIFMKHPPSPAVMTGFPLQIIDSRTTSKELNSIRVASIVKTVLKHTSEIPGGRVPEQTDQQSNSEIDDFDENERFL
jgi:hypothetical protein